MTTQKRSYTAPAGTIISDVKLSEDKKTLITIFEQEKYVPKLGDCVRLKCRNSMHFFEVTHSEGGFVNSKFSILNNEILICEDSDFVLWWLRNHEDYIYEKITPDQLQAKFNAIGYEYDFETHTASKLRWKPKVEEECFFIESTGRIAHTTYCEWGVDKDRLLFGNCFKDRQSAEKLLNYIKQYNP